MRHGAVAPRYGIESQPLLMRGVVAETIELPSYGITAPSFALLVAYSGGDKGSMWTQSQASAELPQVVLKA